MGLMAAIVALIAEIGASEAVAAGAGTGLAAAGTGAGIAGAASPALVGAGALGTGAATGLGAVGTGAGIAGAASPALAGLGAGTAGLGAGTALGATGAGLGTAGTLGALGGTAGLGAGTIPTAGYSLLGQGGTALSGATPELGAGASQFATPPTTSTYSDVLRGGGQNLTGPGADPARSIASANRGPFGTGLYNWSDETFGFEPGSTQQAVTSPLKTVYGKMDDALGLEPGTTSKAMSAVNIKSDLGGQSQKQQVQSSGPAAPSLGLSRSSGLGANISQPPLAPRQATPYQLGAGGLSSLLRSGRQARAGSDPRMLMLSLLAGRRGY